MKNWSKPFSSTQRMGAIALCAALMCMSMAGCTPQQKANVAQEIVNLEPAFVSAVDAVGAGVSVLDPAVAVPVQVFVAAANTLAPQFSAAAQAYLANPSQTTLQVLQAVIVQIQNNVNSSLATLQALKVTNASSQQKAIADVNGVAAIANALLALIQGVSTKAQVAAMSQGITVHLAQVAPELDRAALNRESQRVASDLGVRPVTADQYLAYEANAGF